MPLSFLDALAKTSNKHYSFYTKRHNSFPHYF